MSEKRNVKSYVLKDESSFHALCSQWNKLAKMSLPTSVFLRFEWFYSAWQWRKFDSELNIVCVERGGQLIGILPLVIASKTVYRIVYQCLEFLCVPDTQMCNIISSPDDIETVTKAAVDELLSMGSHWDTLELKYLPKDALFSATLSSIIKKKEYALKEIETFDKNLYFRLDDWPAFYSRKSRRLKKSCNNVRNRINKNFHTVEVKHYKGTDKRMDAFLPVLKTVIQISKNSWKAGTGFSLNNSGPNAFIHALTEKAVEQGWLSLWVLYLEDEAVAMEYQVNDGNNIYALRSDFSVAFSKYSVGTFLNRQIMEKIFDENASAYFMGPGENAYKVPWSEEILNLKNLKIYGPTIRGKALYYIENAIAPLYRKIFEGKWPSGVFKSL